MQVIKRNGTPVSFDFTRITAAIEKAFRAQGIVADVNGIAARVLPEIRKTDVLRVEEIQDWVERAIEDAGYPEVREAYHKYRMSHAKKRHDELFLKGIFDDLTNKSAAAVDMKRENANVNTDTAMGTMLKFGSEGVKAYIDNYVLPADISLAHVDGDIHIHDKDFYLLTETCCQIDLKELLARGFSTGHGWLRPPKRILSYAALACIAIQANQNEMHGGQSVPNFDYAMAEGVRLTYEAEWKNAFMNFLDIRDMPDGEDPHFEEDKKKACELIINICGTPRLGRKAGVMLNRVKWPETLPNGFTREELEQAVRYACRVASKATEAQTYQAMEAVIHNLNSMASRAGAQVPFSSLNYGTDTSPEGRLVVKSLLLATQKGLGHGETPIFPVQIFKVKKGVNFEKDDPNYDLFKLAIETSCKRLFPNFSFLDAPFNLQYYREGDYNSEVAYMGCRTRVMGNVHDPSREITCGRGNLSFTSINLPRLGLKSRNDNDADRGFPGFFRRLDAMIDLCFRQLLHRLEIQSRKTVHNYPFLMGQGVWIDSRELDFDDSVREVLKHGTLTIGFIGLAECLVALTGKHHGEDETARELGYAIVQHMRDRCDEMSKKTKLNFSLIATPGEGLAGRFVPMDRARYGSIPGVTDRSYYTNSFHVPVYFPIKAFRKIDIEAPFHAMTNGGHITYIEMNGDISKNPEAFEGVIRYMAEKGIGYGSVNHPVDRDPVCGYVGVIDTVCPRCGRRDGEGVPLSKLKEIRRKFGAIGSGDFVGKI